jgi:hypothetical protein
MPEQSRNFQHIFVDNWAEPESYVSPSGGRSSAPPARETATHAAALLRSLNGALR